MSWEIAAASEVYASFAVRTVPIAGGRTVTTRHGMHLCAQPVNLKASLADRLMAPDARAADDMDPRVNRWAADHDMDVDVPPAQRADGECSFDAMLRSLAAHTDRATAKSIEYTTDHLQLGGAAWPWRDWPLGALTLAAAAGVGLLPLASHAVTR